MREVVLDRLRGRIYIGDYLRGEVFALAITFREQARWFVGHFVRALEVSRDGHALLVTSALGLVRIELGQPAPP